DHEAARLYARLRPYLAARRPWGCYLPTRSASAGASGGASDSNRRSHQLWPLHYWRGPGTQPLAIEWSRRRDGDRRDITFHEFCLVYGLDLVVGDADAKEEV